MIQYQNIHLIRKALYLFAFLLPLSAIALASQNSLEFINFSYIGNTMQKRFLLIIWGSFSGIYFFLSYLYLSILTKQIHKRYMIACAFACLLMLISILVPYLPKQYAILSSLHLLFAFGSTMSYLVIFYSFVYSLMLYDPIIYTKANSYFMMIVMVCIAVLFAYGGVNSLVEMMFCILMPIYQISLSRMIEQHQKNITNIF